MTRPRSRRISRGLEPWYRRELGGAPYWLLVSAAVVALGVLAIVFTAGPGRPLLEGILSGG